MFNSQYFQMNSVNDLCQSFENVLNIYENDNKNVDEKFTLFTKYLEKRKFHPIPDFSKSISFFQNFSLENVLTCF